MIGGGRVAAHDDQVQQKIAASTDMAAMQRT
jgi:hypothetical protein